MDLFNKIEKQEITISDLHIVGPFQLGTSGLKEKGFIKA